MAVERPGALELTGPGPPADHVGTASASHHPLFGVEHIIARESDCSLAELMADDTDERTTVVRLDDKLRVATSPALIGDLKQLLGPACVS